MIITSKMKIVRRLATSLFFERNRKIVRPISIAKVTPCASIGSLNDNGRKLQALNFPGLGYWNGCQ
jgi:hypothetical protein